MIATGTGIVGSNLQYLDKLHDQLSLLGFDDPAIKALHKRAHSNAAQIYSLPNQCDRPQPSQSPACSHVPMPT
jgi:cation transport regulator ChaC